MQFEYYVLNYDTNKKKVENFNIFRNCLVQEHTEKAVRKYLRSPKNYKYVVQHKNDFLGREEIAVSGLNITQRVDLEQSKNLFTISVILVAGIGKLSLHIGGIKITEIACALILGIIVNAICNIPKKEKNESQNN